MIQRYIREMVTVIKGSFNTIRTKFRSVKSQTVVNLRKKIMQLFHKKIGVRPRNQEDYYALGKWMVSRRLLLWGILIFGMAGVLYMCIVNPIAAFTHSSDGLKTYSYRSVGLRFAKGNVRILGATGYLAYVGKVEKGRCNGEGTLYDANENLVYMGNFENSRFQGEGQEYYPGGQLKYKGTFANNVYQGTGISYRSNGSKEYEGSFSNGKKDGTGVLYDEGNNTVYTGNFSMDHLLYSDFLGKTTAQIASVYTGSRRIYTDDETFCVLLEDIGAMYYGENDSDAVDDETKIGGIYVKSSDMYVDGEVFSNAKDLREHFGTPSYEGNSAVLMPEAVLINQLNEESSEKVLFGKVDMELERTFKDVMTVKTYDDSYLLYLYSYTADNLVYTAVCKEKNGDIAFYLIEKNEVEK